MKNRSVLLLLLLGISCATLSCLPAVAAETADAIVARWSELSQMKINPQADAWIEEGNLIVERYRELQELQTATLDSLSRVQVDKSIFELSVRLGQLLKKVEEARIFSLSPAELTALREQYKREADSLQSAYGELRENILVEGDKFLKTYPDDPLLRKYKRKDVVADVCLQLGELYYQQERDRYFDELERWELRQESAARQGVPFNEPEPELQLQRSVELYLKIINEFPNSDYVADALYNLANICENSTDPVEQREAVELYTDLARRFPDSKYAAEAWMRVGEYWYAAGNNDDYRRAITAYQQVLEYPDFDACDKALYKLGWTHYQLLEYEPSVRYFTEAVQYTRAQQAAGERTLTALEDESIRYIAINYADPGWSEGGTANLASFVRDDTTIYADFGFTLVLTYADLLKEEALDYRLAVDAYDSVLSLYPLRPEGPAVLEKMVQCHADRALNQPQEAYEARNRFSTLFVENEDWLAQNSADTLVAAAREIMNLHQLSNVNHALQEANRLHSEEAYSEFLQQSRHYLQLFPEDSNAFQVHWNLAKVLEAPLNRYSPAWEEFLQITTLYHPEWDVMPAAINAIVMAQNLIAVAPVMEPDSAVAWPLSREEEMLVEALNRFQELFPEEETSPQYLFTNGGLYHEHRLWAEARVIFDQLIEKYPASPLVADAHLFCIEGFFAEQMFAEAEAKAQDLLALDPSPEVATQAQQTIAQAVFSGAEVLRSGDDHMAAAAEFKRVALDVPDADFADASLFDAAAEYRKAEAWMDAADTYLMLVERYASSEFADRSLRLAAYTYLNELEDMTAAGQAFERLALEYPDSEYRQEALTNAGICFEKAEDPLSALRVNDLYLSLWPDADNAASVMFGNAALYLKLDQISAANNIYRDFAERFPNDPRTVRAYYERGQYYLSHEDSVLAAGEFRLTTARNRELKQGGYPTNDYYAARALRNLVLWEYDAYRVIQLRQPPDQLERLLVEKKSARKSLLDQLYELIAYTTRDLFQARYLIAATHEDFAVTYLNQEQPAYANQEDEIAALDRIDAAAAELNTIAREDYLLAVSEMTEALAKIGERRLVQSKWQTELQRWLEIVPDTVTTPEDSLNQLLELNQSVALLDTTVIEGEHWIRQARQRVPAIAWATAERSEERIRMFYSAPIIRGVPEVRFNYRDAVLSRFVMPATRDCITAYMNVLEQASQVELAGTWHNRVQERFLHFAGYTLAGYRELFQLATDATAAMGIDFLTLLEQGEDAVDADGMAAGDLGFYYLDLTDYRQNYLMNSIQMESQLLEAYQNTGIAAPVVQARGDSVLYHLLQAVTQLEADQEFTAAQRDFTWQRFEDTGSWVWEDANATWDDANFALSDNVLIVLTTANELIETFQLEGAIVNRVWFKLAQLDPEQFGERFGLTEQSINIGTSTSWLVSDTYRQGYVAPGFDDSDWRPATLTGNSEIVQRAGLSESGAVAIWLESAPPPVVVPDTTAPDTTQLVAAVEATADSLWFRYRFILDEVAIAAEIAVTADDNYSIYLNGEYIDEDRSGSDDWGDVRLIDLQDYVVTGENTLAAEVVDEDGSGRGLLVNFALRTVPRLTDDVFEDKLREDTERANRLERELERDRLYDRHKIY